MTRTTAPPDHTPADGPNRTASPAPPAFPRSIPGETASDFNDRVEAVRVALAPADLIEALVVERFLDALRQLRACDRLLSDGPPDALTLRAEAQADRLFWRALRELRAMRKNPLNPVAPAEPQTDARPTRKRKAAESPADPEPEVPAEPAPEIVLDPTPVNWRETIVLDPTRSRHWPVVRGTNVTAEQVAGMLGEDWPISEILRYYPDITVDDIRACRDCRAERMCGPWDPDLGVNSPPNDWD